VTDTLRPGGSSTEIIGNTMQEQIRQCLHKIHSKQPAARSTAWWKVTVLLARPDLYKEMNEAYAEFFPKAKPARAMVRFGANIPGVLVGNEAIALA
jgi:enamine deaminase RidA (YjgF/YER057c/UK114 family)